MGKNVASGNDVVAFQIGQIGGRPDSGQAPEPVEPGPTVNTRSGNATVGAQVDEIDTINIRMPD